MKVHSIHTNKKTLSWKRSGNSSWSYFPMFVSQWLLGRWRESEGHLCPRRLLCGNCMLPSVSPLMAPLPSLLPCTTAAVCLNTNLLKSTTDTPSHLPPSLPHIHTHTEQNPSLLTVRWVNACAGRMQLFSWSRLCTAWSAVFGGGGKRGGCIYTTKGTV